MKRIEAKFKELQNQKKCAFIGYICAGDPDYKTSLEILKVLPQSGCDIIELGVPFLDPAGDGPIIEMAAKRAIAAGMTLAKVLEMVREFRKIDKKTPLILMSYYNPIHYYGLDKIFLEAEESGVDGFLIVDLPMEEEHEILHEVQKTKLDLIRLISPTTPQERVKKIVKNASGFLYLISMLGITGTKLASAEDNKENLHQLRKVSNMPVAIGFGIKTAQQVKEFAKMGADGVVIGSEIVKEIGQIFDGSKNQQEALLSLQSKIKALSE